MINKTKKIMKLIKIIIFMETQNVYGTNFSCFECQVTQIHTYFIYANQTAKTLRLSGYFQNYVNIDICDIYFMIYCNFIYTLYMLKLKQNRHKHLNICTYVRVKLFSE